jgi:hypothetical protein
MRISHVPDLHRPAVMKTAPIPDQATLHELLTYDPVTGKLYWKARDIRTFTSASRGATWNKRFAGKEAFTTLRPDGYYGGSIHYVNYLAHRIIFKWLHGYDPDQVDHDDRDRTNNRPANLIDASAEDNSKNCKLFSSNTSGFMGVSWDSRRNAWKAQIKTSGKDIYLGRFEDINDAIDARQRAEIRHGFHPNHGK